MFFGRGVTKGVTERGYIFQRKGLQKWVLGVWIERGEKYRFLKLNVKNGGDRCKKLPTVIKITP